MKVFMFAPVLRAGSFNKKLIRAAADLVKKYPFCEVQLHDFNEFPMPVYDGDIEATGLPQGVKDLGQKISEADALIISCPEYNGSIPGPFKNAIDWVSRLKPLPFSKKQILFLGATPGALGAVRGNIHLRVPFHVLGAFVYPEYFGLAKADEAFNEDGSLKDAKQVEKLKAMIHDFIHYASRKETPFENLEEFVQNHRN